MYTVKRAFLYVLKLAFILSELLDSCFVVETPSLLPFQAPPLLFRRRDGFSSTFPGSSTLVSSQRHPLFYLSRLLHSYFVVETASLLPFRTPRLLFRHRNGFSSTFPGSSTLVSSQKRLLFYLFKLSDTPFVVEIEVIFLNVQKRLFKSHKIFPLCIFNTLVGVSGMISSHG